MPKFAANLTFLFKEYPFLERFAEAKIAGFDAVEVLFPYDDAANEIERRMKQSGLPLVLINTPPPNWAGGDRGFAAIPGGEKRFRSDFTRALRFAQRLGALHIHIMAGKAQGLVAKKTFVENLKWAAAQAPKQSLTIEPINPVDMPGYFLNDFDQAADIIERVGAANLGLQFDTYHAHAITGDMLATWARHRRRVSHIQIASVPGRHEPDQGAIDYTAFFAQIDAEGYVGWVSAEYMPRGRTEDGTGWLSASVTAPDQVLQNPSAQDPAARTGRATRLP
ncbi:hydroxypyruvate isomerase family protein [Candidatus Halocynthiibacter alkanivorans]|uniref:hydroxypyruvate isomerase family protein n=1 Tax=Candidatus Halocynthiibacter alkanivorans TaxID=2267619 RepID=UPI000DF2CB47|nr:TIM barrel protein [Candidatus Halocynthiibacter alkanivorans]